VKESRYSASDGYLRQRASSISALSSHDGNHPHEHLIIGVPERTAQQYQANAESDIGLQEELEPLDF
jgi:hypothetical protein